MTRLDGADISQLPAQILAKIEVQADGCWHWMGARMPTGHGNAYLAGRFFGAHRLVYSMLVGEIEPGMLIHHECEVPYCVNPAHLHPMTKKQHSAEHGLSGVAAQNAARTTCRNGHPFDGHNGRQRTCATCRSATRRRWEQRQRAA